MDLQFEVRDLDVNPHPRSLQDVRTLMVTIANDILVETRGCPPLLLGLTLANDVRFGQLEFPGQGVEVTPEIARAAALEMHRHTPMDVMAFLLPLSFSTAANGHDHGAYLTLQQGMTREQHLYLLAADGFVDGRFTDIQMGFANPFEFLEQRLLA